MICDPPVNVYKGYCMPRDTEAYILSCGLKNALYSIRAADLKADLFGDLIPCSFQQPADKDKKRSQGLMGAEWGGAIRQELYYLLKDVYFTFGSVQVNGVNDAEKGMGSSKFCLNIARDIPSSNRLFDAIASHCVPVIISDKMELPFEDVLDYSEFYIFVRASDAVKKGFLLNLLRGITRENWTRMWERLKHITRHFEYQYPTQPGDAVDMIWQAVSRKISLV